MSAYEKIKQKVAGMFKQDYLKKVKRGWIYLLFVPESKQTMKMYLSAVSQSYLALEYVPENRRTSKLCHMAVRQNGFSLRYVPEKLRDARMIIDAIPTYGINLEFLQDSDKTYDLCMKAVQNNGTAFFFVPERHKTYELCETAVESRGEMFLHMPDKYVTQDMYFRAIESLEKEYKSKRKTCLKKIYTRKSLREHKELLKRYLENISTLASTSIEVDEMVAPTIDKDSKPLKQHLELTPISDSTGVEIDKSSISERDDESNVLISDTKLNQIINSVINPEHIQRVRSHYDMKDIYNQKKYHKRLPDAGIDLWWRKNTSSDMIYEMDIHSLKLIIINPETSERTEILFDDMEREIEKLLRDGYPESIPVGKVVYCNFGINEPVIYHDANSIYKRIEEAEYCGDSFDVTLYSVNGKSICSERFDNNVHPKEGIVYYEHLEGYKVIDYSEDFESEKEIIEQLRCLIKSEMGIDYSIENIYEDLEHEAYDEDDILLCIEEESIDPTIKEIIEKLPWQYS